MNGIYNFISNWYKRFKGITEETENDDPIIIHPCSTKRRLDESMNTEVLPKKKKLITPLSVKDGGDLCESSYLFRNTLSDFQKENQRMSSDNLKINEVLRKRQKLPRVKREEVYCIDEDDAEIHSRSNGLLLETEFNIEDGSRKNDRTQPAEDNDCVIVGETQPVSSRPSYLYPKLCLNRVQNMNEQTTFLMMVKNQCIPARKSTPLKNSAIHNTKQNRNISSDSLSNRSFSFRNYLSSAKWRSPVLQMKPAESVFDKVVIDLTATEDDEDQRQAIESRIISSPEIRNMKSSFVAEDTYALDEDIALSIAKKYAPKLQKIKTRASKIEKAVKDNEEEFAKTICEILEKRLSIKEHVEPVEDVSVKPSIEIAPVTKEMIVEINKILGSKQCPLVQIKDTSVKLQDIRTLENMAWLNDEVINAYMNLIKQRYEDNPDKYPKVHCFNTFLYEQLNRKGYDSVRRWTRKVDIFAFEILIIPIHLGNHWCLVQVRFSEKLVAYYDSMGSPNHRCLNSMKQYLVEEYRDKKNGMFDISGWKLINFSRDEIPQQKNAHDCGVFACTFAEHITRNAPFNFDQDHMPYFRLKMTYEILTGKLLL